MDLIPTLLPSSLDLDVSSHNDDRDGTGSATEMPASVRKSCFVTKLQVIYSNPYSYREWAVSKQTPNCLNP
jgi:hypothetical protein